MKGRLLIIICLCLFIGGVFADGVVDTGQTSCYDTGGTSISCPSQGEALFGQDANYRGAAPAYQDNGDGTVTDLNTGLMWQKSPSEKVTFVDALANASAFNLGNYSDWRVPTIKELYTLMDFSGSTGLSENDAVPYIDTNYFDFEYGDTSAGERYIDAQFWSSNEYVSTTMNGNATVFGVNFADGRIKGYERDTNMRGVTNTLFLRYVRGEAYGVNDFVDNGDNTITDQNSGLTWMQFDSGTFGAGSKGDGGLNWEEALDWCENLTLAGADDWRLPNAKELQGLVDYTRSPDTTNSAAIDPLFRVTAVADPNNQMNFAHFWTGTTHLDGAHPGDYAVYVTFGRAQGFMESPPNSGNYQLMDVHGAGAQRSDPKTGNPDDFPTGHGPQGDVIMIYNHARCVRGGSYEIFTGGTVDSTSNNQSDSGQPPAGGQPPQEAIDACNNLSAGATCQFNSPQGSVSGTCTQVESQMACAPAGGAPGG